MRLVWSALAIERVVETGEQIARAPVAAAEWVRGILAAVERLPESNLSGRRVPEIRRPSVREIIQGDYRLIYRVDPDAVVILTVRHARQRVTPADAEP